MIKKFKKLKTNHIYQGDVKKILKKLPSNTVDCVVTSPPYWNLRDYQTGKWIGGNDPKCKHIKNQAFSSKTTIQKNQKKVNKGRELYYNHKCPKCGAIKKDLQIGAEKTPTEFVNTMVKLFRQINRILKNTGTVWLNLGDTYMGGGRGGGSDKQKTNKGSSTMPNSKSGKLPAKNLVGIPWRVALALQDDGWILRQEIIWSKPSCMPECLDPSTEILVKNNKLIKIKQLSEIKIGDYIAAPDGWKKVLNKWETCKRPVDLKMGKWGSVVSSKDHKFPVSHDRRRLKTDDTMVKDIRTDGHSDYLLWKSIEHLIDENEVPKFVDVSSIDDNYVALLSDNDIEKYKQGIINKYDSIKNWVMCNDTNMEIKGRNYYSKLHYALQLNRIPLNILKKDAFCTDNILVKGFRENDDKAVNSKFILDYDMGKLIGLFIAEGGKNGTGGNGIKWTFHSNESKYIKFISNQLNIIGLNSSVCPDKRCNAQYIITASKVLSDFFKLYIDGTCTEKKLNLPNLLNTPKEFRKGVWDGYIDGDGWKIKNVERVGSASRQLIYDFKYLVSSIGYLGSIYEYTYKDKRNKNNKQFYNYLLNLTYKNKRQCKKGTNFKQIKPTEIIINEKAPKQPMIDIEVEGNLFLISDGLISHNSVTDRCTKSHEHIFLLTKSPNYYFNHEIIKESSTHKESYTGKRPRRINSLGKSNMKYHQFGVDDNGVQLMAGKKYPKRNKRTVWEVPITNYKGAHFACVDEETEIYTLNGWKKYSEIKLGDSILSYDLKSQTIKKDEILDLYKGAYSGNMIKTESRDLSMVLTPDHRTIVRDYRSKKEKIIRADELLNRHEIPLTAPVSTKFDKNPDIDGFLTGLILSDGWFNSSWYIGQYTFENHKLLFNLNAKLDYVKLIHTKPDKRNGIVLKMDLKKSKWLMGLIKNRRKPDNSFILNSSKEWIKEFFDGFVAGDGNIRKDGRITIVKTKELIDLIQSVCVRLGYTCRVSKIENKTWCAFVTFKKQYVSLRGTNATGLNDGKSIIGKINYNGIIWCPKTNNTTWIARRNGNIFITGNTFPIKLIEPCILAGCPKGGVVLDPFFGSGTTGSVAKTHNRKYVGIELNKKYIKLAKQRLSGTLQNLF